MNSFKATSISAAPLVTTTREKPYRQYFIAICLFYLLIAIWLSVRIKFGVMDEPFHLEYSIPFAKFGVNSTTLYRHVPPTGVASHLWFALWLWLFPSINYIGLRLITCVVVTGLAGATYFHLKTLSANWQRRVLEATVFMLICPYFFLSVSTVMTEGPSLVFLFAGLLLLSISQFQRIFPFFLACLFFGLTTIARFYYLPLLPALFTVLLFADWTQYKQFGFKSFTKSRLLMYVSIGISLLPLLGLLILWGGFTPPLFHQWSKLRSELIFNGLRPISTVIITGIYIAPFILLNVSWKAHLFRALNIVLLIALIFAIFQINLLHDTSSVNDVLADLSNTD